MSSAPAWSGFLVLGLLVCLAIAGLIAPFASTAPDGFEKVAEQQGFAPEEADSETEETWQGAPMPDYQMPGIERSTLSRSLAGIAGTVLVFLIAFGLGKLLAWRRGTAKNLAPDGS